MEDIKKEDVRIVALGTEGETLTSYYAQSIPSPHYIGKGDTPEEAVIDLQKAMTAPI